MQHLSRCSFLTLLFQGKLLKQIFATSSVLCRRRVPARRAWSAAPGWRGGGVAGCRGGPEGASGASCPRVPALGSDTRRVAWRGVAWGRTARRGTARAGRPDPGNKSSKKHGSPERGGRVVGWSGGQWESGPRPVLNLLPQRVPNPLYFMASFQLHSTSS